MDIEFFLQLTVNGILLGGFYATMTLGFSIIWGVMRLINLAHGEFLLMAAYVAWFFFNPHREQNLSIGSESPDEVLSTINLMFWGIALVIGLFASDFIFNRQYVHHLWQARLFGLAFGVVAARGAYFIWQGNDFEQIVIPVNDLMRIGLSLSLGFVLSHIVFTKVIGIFSESADRYPLDTTEKNVVNAPEGFALDPYWLIGPLARPVVDFVRQLPALVLKNEIWIRRLIAYPIGFIVFSRFFDIWGRDGFEPLDPYEIIPLIILLFYALGYALQNNLLNRLVEGPYLTMLLITFSLQIILQSLGLRIYAADPRKISPDYSGAFWTRADITGPDIHVPILGIDLPNPLGIIPETAFPDITVPQDKTYVLFVSAILIAVLVLFLRRTRTGYAIRAAAQNKNAARLVGIDIKETYAITFGISLAATAVAGSLMGTFQPITPIGGPRWTLRAFAIVALGGLGRIQGVVIGGMLLGLVESYIGGYLPRLNDAIPQIEIVNATGWAIAAAFIILVVMLVVRPQGISGGLVLEED
jgi:branched-chain amino acid transport system permease protein